MPREGHARGRAGGGPGGAGGGAGARLEDGWAAGLGCSEFR